MVSKSLHNIIQLVEAKLGLKLNSISLFIWKDKIQERMIACQLHSYEGYERLINISQQEMRELIELIVNSETWFFRERGAFDYLISYIEQAKEKISHFRILSIACSTGEEPYSIAMALLDAGLSLKDFRIDALDISHKALKKAKEGVYRKISFRGDNIDFRNRYFNEVESGYIIKNQIKQCVNFYDGNILEDSKTFDFYSYHIIFCRNLLIYLNQDSQKKLLNFFKTLLIPQGILILGLAEGKIALSAGFELVMAPGASVFKMDFKKIDTSEKKTYPKASNLKNPSMHVKNPAVISFQPTPNFLQLNSSLEEKSDKACLLQEALKIANEGSFEEAKYLCSLYIQHYGAHPEIYYLLGLLYHNQGNEKESKKYLHKAIYLDPSHSEALICLALLYESEGNKKQADLFRKRALKKQQNL